MIFWWSEFRLKRFIEVCLQQGYLQKEIDVLNSCVDANKRNITGLGKAINEYRAETTQEIDGLNCLVTNIRDDISNKPESVTVDIEGIVEKIKTDCIQYVNANV